MIKKKRFRELVRGVPKPVFSTMSHFSTVGELHANAAQKRLGEEDEIYRSFQGVSRCPDIKLSYMSIPDIILRKKRMFMDVCDSSVPEDLTPRPSRSKAL